MSNKIKVLIADDHTIVRKGIRALMMTEPDIHVVGEAVNGKQAVSLAAEIRPDVILMDLVMPEMGGIEAIRTIKENQPEIPILVLTSFSTDEKVFPAIKAGASGYLLKDSDPEELVRAIQDVYRGQSSLHPKIARMVLKEMAAEPTATDPHNKPRAAGHPSPVDPLTERELEVLKLVARGLGNAEIAGQLVVAEGTVRTHVSNILGKLHLASRTQATLYALREGLASLDDREQG
jgi:NarL family two-component system response regulator LiaR